jgi:hypothetical protein
MRDVRDARKETGSIVFLPSLFRIPWQINSNMALALPFDRLYSFVHVQPAGALAWP